MNGGRIALWLLAFGLVAAGCHAALSLDDLELVDSTTAPGGTGGTGLSGGGGTGGSTGGTAGTGGAGGNACDPDTCPTDPTGCRHPICTAEGCDFENGAVNDSCTDTGNPAAKVCDGEGNCVECNDVSQCDDPTEFQCDDHHCVPLHCYNGQVDQGETGEDCGGTTGCPPCPNGQGCNLPTDCLSHFCDGNTCAACSDPALDCAADHWCNPDNNGGTCEPDKDDGAPCVGNGECISDACYVRYATPGVCCQSGCDTSNDNCRSCLNAHTNQADGLCRPIVDGSDPYSACPESGVDCGGDACDGTGICQKLTGGEDCGMGSCTGNTYTSFACDVSGTCAPTAMTCPDGLICNPMTNGCYASCQGDDARCLTDHWCHPSGVCPADRPIGSYCVRNEQCQPGGDSVSRCVDGVCCNAACSGLCRACDARRTKKTAGQCDYVDGRTDPDEECGAGCCEGTSAACSGTFICDSYRCDASLPPTTGCTEGSPPLCGGSCSGSPFHTCTYNCAAGDCTAATIQCPFGSNCVVNCGSTAASWCKGKTIVCPPNNTCTVNCADGGESCTDATVVCSANGPCNLNCGDGNSCLGTEQICGAEACNTTCDPTGADPATNCGLTCSAQCPSASCL